MNVYRYSALIEETMEKEESWSQEENTLGSRDPSYRIAPGALHSLAMRTGCVMAEYDAQAVKACVQELVTALESMGPAGRARPSFAPLEILCVMLARYVERLETTQYPPIRAFQADTHERIMETLRDVENGECGKNYSPEDTYAKLPFLAENASDVLFDQWWSTAAEIRGGLGVRLQDACPLSSAPRPLPVLSSWPMLAIKTATQYACGNHARLAGNARGTAHAPADDLSEEIAYIRWPGAATKTPQEEKERIRRQLFFLLWSRGFLGMDPDGGLRFIPNALEYNAQNIPEVEAE